MIECICGKTWCRQTTVLLEEQWGSQSVESFLRVPLVKDDDYTDATTTTTTAARTIVNEHENEDDDDNDDSLVTSTFRDLCFDQFHPNRSRNTITCTSTTTTRNEEEFSTNNNTKAVPQHSIHIAMHHFHPELRRYWREEQRSKAKTLQKQKATTTVAALAGVPLTTISSTDNGNCDIDTDNGSDYNETVTIIEERKQPHQLQSQQQTRMLLVPEAIARACGFNEEANVIMIRSQVTCTADNNQQQQQQQHQHRMYIVVPNYPRAQLYRDIQDFDNQNNKNRRRKNSNHDNKNADNHTTTSDDNNNNSNSDMDEEEDASTSTDTDTDTNATNLRDLCLEMEFSDTAEEEYYYRTIGSILFDGGAPPPTTTNIHDDNNDEKDSNDSNNETGTDTGTASITACRSSSSRLNAQVLRDMSLTKSGSICEAASNNNDSDDDDCDCDDQPDLRFQVVLEPSSQTFQRIEALAAKVGILDPNHSFVDKAVLLVGGTRAQPLHSDIYVLLQPKSSPKPQREHNDHNTTREKGKEDDSNGCESDTATLVVENDDTATALDTNDATSDEADNEINDSSIHQKLHARNGYCSTILSLQRDQDMRIGIQLDQVNFIGPNMLSIQGDPYSEYAYDPATFDGVRVALQVPCGFQFRGDFFHSGMPSRLVEVEHAVVRKKLRSIQKSSSSSNTNTGDDNDDDEVQRIMVQQLQKVLSEHSIGNFSRLFLFIHPKENAMKVNLSAEHISYGWEEP